MYEARLSIFINNSGWHAVQDTMLKTVQDSEEALLISQAHALLLEQHKEMGARLLMQLNEHFQILKEYGNLFLL